MADRWRPRISFVIPAKAVICQRPMRSNSISRYLKSIADFWLTASVHFDAFLFEPRAYLTATKWWIKRKRVRARGQFAPLLSRSPRAYLLWTVRQERVRRRHSPIDVDRPIIALIDTRANCAPKDIAATLESLASEGLSVLLIGTPETPTLGAVTSQMDWGKRPWVLPIAAGDRIGPGTASAYRAAMDDPVRRLIYADDDLLTGRRRRKPYFKPDWNAELFAYGDYISGACIIRPFRSDFEVLEDRPDWAEQLTAKIAVETEPLHLPEMLHHRRSRPLISVPAVPLNVARDLPSVSIIVPTRNRVDLLRTCLDGVMATHYPDIEVIVVDNDSDDPDTLAYLGQLEPARYKVLRHAGAFNYSAINNRAVECANSRLICLLNNDIEVREAGWLATMATQALRPEVGAVGARLLYPDGRIQHAGVVIGVGNAAGHAHRFLHPDEEGYFQRHSLPQFTAAVTAACLVVEREKFLAVGGLNETDFAVAFNDVDLCLRLNQKGWQSLYEPRATLIHHESVSRGLDRDSVGSARFSGELAALKRLWKTDEIYDPYHHPHLSRASEQFAVAL